MELQNCRTAYFKLFSYQLPIIPMFGWGRDGGGGNYLYHIDYFYGKTGI